MDGIDELYEILESERDAYDKLNDEYEEASRLLTEMAAAFKAADYMSFEAFLAEEPTLSEYV